jgi:hypothetical protein
MQSNLVLVHHPGAPGAAALGSAAGAPTTDPGNVNRRRSPRYSAVNDRLWMGWWSGDEFLLIQASLINISSGGVLVGVNPSPTEGQVVWMRLERSPLTESLAAVVLESKWSVLKRRFGVRLAFRQTCPSAFFQAALLDLGD